MEKKDHRAPTAHALYSLIYTYISSACIVAQCVYCPGLRLCLLAWVWVSVPWYSAYLDIVRYFSSNFFFFHFSSFDLWVAEYVLDSMRMLTQFTIYIHFGVFSSARTEQASERTKRITKKSNNNERRIKQKTHRLTMMLQYLRSLLLWCVFIVRRGQVYQAFVCILGKKGRKRRQQQRKK